MVYPRLLFALFIVFFIAGCGASASYDKSMGAPELRLAAAPGEAYTEAAAYAMDDQDYFFEGETANYELSRDRGPLRQEVEVAEAPQKQPQEGSPSEPEGDAPQKEQAGKRIVIYTAHFVIAVIEVEVALKQTSDRNQALGGWTQASTSDSLTLRVPAENFEILIEELRAMGAVLNENIVGQDVTEEFLDIEIRLKNALAMRERYVALLEKATTVKEALAIEAELGRLTAEIEVMKGRLRYLSEQAAYSTITVSFREQEQQAQERQHIELPFGWMRYYHIGNLYENY